MNLPNQQQPQGPPLKFSMADARDIACSCGSLLFMPAFRFKKLSKLLTGGAKDSNFPIEVFLCVQCGKPLEEMLPEELKSTKIHGS